MCMDERCTVSGFVILHPRRVVCLVCVVTYVDLVGHTKPWHLCPSHATLRGMARPARGTWQHSVYLYA